jgi:hypothetical protein
LKQPDQRHRTAIAVQTHNDIPKNPANIAANQKKRRYPKRPSKPTGYFNETQLSRKEKRERKTQT